MTHEQKAAELQEHYDMLDAQKYYYETYLTTFDKDNGEPVCFAEFYDNDWEDIKKGE